MDKVFRSFEDLASHYGNDASDPSPPAKPHGDAGPQRAKPKNDSRTRPRGERDRDWERTFNARVRELREAERRAAEKQAELEAEERAIDERRAALDRQKQQYTLLLKHLDVQKLRQETTSRNLADWKRSLGQQEADLRKREADLRKRDSELSREHAAALRKLRAREKEIGQELEKAAATAKRLHSWVDSLARDRDTLAVEKRKLVQLNQSLEDQVADQERMIAALSAKVEAQGAVTIRDPIVREWLADGPLSAKFSGSANCVGVGSGPWPADEFEGLLRAQGFVLYEPADEDAEIMIVGREGWTESELDQQLEAREGTTLRVYSQEMFLLAMATGRDPFDTDPTVLRAFGKGHPALEYLVETALNWPAVTVPLLDDIDFSDFESNGLASETPLRSLGYKVGRTGLALSERREILDRAFRGEIPFVNSQEYMKSWGSKGSRRRLARIAHHLAWLARMHHTNPSKVYAVKDWEADLDWLKRTYYKRWMRFKWPTVRV